MLLVAVDGASPGVGKSTLCNGLAASLAAAGTAVDHFREEEILSRPEFADVAEQFTATQTVRLDSIVDAVTAFVINADANGTEVIVADALLPFIPSLIVWGYDESAIGAFLDRISAAIAPARVVLLYVDGDPDVALRRAADREEPGWLEWLVGKLGVPDRAAAIRHLENQRDLTLRLVGRQPWELIVLSDALERSPDQLLQAALEHL